MRRTVVAAYPARWSGHRCAAPISGNSVLQPAKIVVDEQPEAARRGAASVAAGRMASWRNKTRSCGRFYGLDRMPTSGSRTSVASCGILALRSARAAATTCSSSLG